MPSGRARILDSIASQQKRSSKAAATVVQFLAGTGLRISEAQSLRWRDIEPEAFVLRTAKNDELRRVPLTTAAKEALETLRAMFPSGAQDPVFPMKSPRIALANACKRLGLPHLRIHGLRHIFATRTLEAGVDVPTVAAWLGHQDGGALAMRTYSHMIEKHSDQQIHKVRI
ncbi:tyrosine-type recombinase/integrase [Haloferula sargassicola]|uniref:Tyrosine recombinase XerC n=1 Tax=Haloferula sargassicola TaxID=490096 RepID=A0ABP9USK7_9BACT